VPITNDQQRLKSQASVMNAHHSN